MNRMWWSEYYTCKGCEDEVNHKGHLIKPKETGHVENVKNNLTLRNLLNIKCYNMQRVW